MGGWYGVAIQSGRGWSLAAAGRLKPASFP